MNNLRRTGYLALALLAAANQWTQAEETVAPAPVKVAEVPPAAPAAPAAPVVEAAPSAKVAEVAPETVQPATTPAVITPEKPLTKPLPAADGMLADVPVHGFVRSRYQGRWTEGAKDHDLYETLSVDVGDPERHRVTGHFLGDLSLDLDGNTRETGYNPFDSVRDSKGSDAVPRVYSAYLDIHRVGPVSILRAGRQTIYETPEIAFFDGVRAETEELGANKLKVGAYGGVPVHLYDGYSTDNRIGGVYGQGHLWQGARTRADFERLEGRNGSEEYKNNLLGLSGWQKVYKLVDLHGRYTRLDNQNRDVLTRVTFTKADWDFRFQASYYELLRAQKATVIETDAFYPILKDAQPYRDYRFLASKGLGDHVNVDAGTDIRRLTHRVDESAYNHQYNRYFGTLDLFDLVVKGSSLSFTAEKAVTQETNSDAQGVDLTVPVADRHKVSVGTAHQLYKYDYYLDEERENVQTYYLKYDFRYTKTLRFGVKYEYEDDGSSGHYNELRCEALCSF